MIRLPNVFFLSLFYFWTGFVARRLREREGV
jgi:hypothetical protein